MIGWAKREKKRRNMDEYDPEKYYINPYLWDFLTLATTIGYLCTCASANYSNKEEIIFVVILAPSSVGVTIIYEIS